ncbi:type II secretion system protein [Bacillus salitolerans]|uniref:Type II secretion system protein n=1 Tax=Bacillus salitolerans TaxID=1437434 RepID=A0ABW4LLF9_9BACI
MKKIKDFMKKWKEQAGLTLVELLAVIVILGIIAGIAVPSIGGIIENSKKDAHISNAIMLANAAKLANIDRSTAGSDSIYTITELNTGGYLEGTPPSPGNAGEYDPANSKVEIAESSGVVTYTITLQDTTATPHIYINGELLSALQADGARALVVLE